MLDYFEVEIFQLNWFSDTSIALLGDSRKVGYRVRRCVRNELLEPYTSPDGCHEALVCPRLRSSPISSALAGPLAQPLWSVARRRQRDRQRDRHRRQRKGDASGRRKPVAKDSKAAQAGHGASKESNRIEAMLPFLEVPRDEEDWRFALSFAPDADEGAARASDPRLYRLASTNSASEYLRRVRNLAFRQRDGEQLAHQASENHCGSISSINVSCIWQYGIALCCQVW